MTEVLLENFDSLYPEIEKAIQNAKFIAIDTEFTALYTTFSNKQSLFDTPVERYTKLRETANAIIPIQIGLTAFNFDPDQIQYTGNTYTFYIWPRPYRNINHTLLFTASSFQFLCRHNFDYNKLIYHGVPFLNVEQEQRLLNDLKNPELLSGDSDIENDLENIIPIISTWFYKNETGAKLDISEHILTNNFEFAYSLHKFIRNRFQNVIWTYEEDGKFMVWKVAENDYLELSKKYDLEEIFRKKMLGFSRIFKLLIEAKKPLVGHNLFLDLLLLHSTFYKGLPTSFKEFKIDLNKNFPTIFDTKTLSFNIGKLIPKNKQWKNSSLSHLYEYFKDSQGRHLVLHSPLIELENRSGSAENFHNAGWDSYCTGYIFIRMAHIFAMSNKTISTRQVTSTEHLAAVRKFKNEINLIRCSTSSTIIDGEDPVSTRPPRLILEATNKASINMTQLTASLSSFGNVEVKAFSDNRVIVAIDNYKSSKRIMEHFKYNKEYKIQQYNIVKHSKWGKFMIWSGVILSLGVICTAFRQTRR